jgi:hypothetical protein
MEEDFPKTEGGLALLEHELGWGHTYACR